MSVSESNANLPRKSAAIMQPTFLPWLGYFSLLDSVDRFVFLDDVQFDKRSWQQRNQIKGPNGAQWLTIPVLTKGCRGQLISEVRISPDSDWTSKHLQAIEYNYKKAPHLADLLGILHNALEVPHQFLATLNIRLIKDIAIYLGIETPVVCSSTLNTGGTKAEKLANICGQLNIGEYLSPPGSAEYISESTVFDERGISVYFQQYKHPEYGQLFGPFLPFMSIADLIANEGKDSLHIIRKGAGKVSADEFFCKTI